MDSRQPTADAVFTGEEADSPQPRRPSLSSIWAFVVRGDAEHNSLPLPPEQSSGSDSSLIESSGCEAPPESSDGNTDSNAGRLKRST